MEEEDGNLSQDETRSENTKQAAGNTVGVICDKQVPIGAAEIRAARGFLSWTARDLAEKAGVSFSTVRRIEDAAGKPVRKRSIEAIRSAFEQHGIRFVRSPNGASGMLFTNAETTDEA